MMDKMKNAMSGFGHNEQNYSIYNQYGENFMPPQGPLGIVPLLGAEGFSSLVNQALVERRNEYLESEGVNLMYPGFVRENYQIPVNCVRFATGEGKAAISRTVRGHDLYLISDPLNYSCTYKMFGVENRMSPDDHYQNLIRVILACSGKARRINVIMPYLYEGRQHRRTARESLDCAYMLEELFGLGIANFITFDAHDDRVSNSVPTGGFESIPSAYQILKAMFRTIDDLEFSPERMIVISPDEGGIMRSMYYASILGLPLGTFYKRRDYTQVVNGRNPIIAHEFLGESVEGLDVLIVDDMISSGESMLDLARILKQRGARRIFCAATFALFTDGLGSFNKAYEAGLIDHVFSTNLVYHTNELLAAPWYTAANMSKFVALLIDSINHDASVSELLDPTTKINTLLKSKRS